MSQTIKTKLDKLRASYFLKPSIVVKPPAVIKPSVVTIQKGLVKALLVGINYIGTPYELAGCINDVKNMQNQLQTFFPSCKEYRVLTDDISSTTKPSKQAIFDGISWLVKDLKPGQNVVFHYSGHGGLVRDTNGDEVSGYDGCIFPMNNGNLEQIIDDELRNTLCSKIPKGCKCFVVLDCCHSGTAVDLKYNYTLPSVNSVLMTQNSKYSNTNGTVVFISGCQDNQVAADTVDKNGVPCGALTMALLDTWKKWGVAIKLKYLLWDTLQFLQSNNYSQRPNMTTGTAMDVNSVFDLRS